MTKMVSVMRVTRPFDDADVATFMEAHDKYVSPYADRPTILKNPNDPTQVALVGEVHDLDGLRKITRSPEALALNADKGFMEQLYYFMED